MPGIDPHEVHAGLPPPAATILDVRDPASFARGHLAGAGHLPRDEFAARRTELPPRDACVLVVGESPEQARAAAADLEALGYARVDWLDAPLAALPAGLADRGPASRLWRPAPFLEQVLPRLTPGRALDLAAGAGREAVFLAMHGFTVEAVDDDPDILVRAEALAGRHGVRIGTRVVDLERRGTTLPREHYDLVIVFRFLHRPLFPEIERALAPAGGWCTRPSGAARPATAGPPTRASCWTTASFGRPSRPSWWSTTRSWTRRAGRSPLGCWLATPPPGNPLDFILVLSKMMSMSSPIDVLASPRRREILRLVWREERAAGEIHRALGDVTFGAVSQHLSGLVGSGLVEMRRQGRRRLYRARRQALGPIGRALEDLWDDALYTLTLRAELEESRRGPRPIRGRRSRRHTGGRR